MSTVKVTDATFEQDVLKAEKPVRAWDEFTPQLYTLALELTEYDPKKIHGSRISRETVHRVTQELLAMTRANRAQLAPMHEGRIDVIGGGALVLDRIMEFMQISEVVVSETDILDGIALALVG